MKYTKTVEITIEITEELIAHLNETYGEENDEDYHDLESLESLLDELVFIPTFYAYSDVLGEKEEFSDLLTKNETSGLVGIEYPD